MKAKRQAGKAGESKGGRVASNIRDFVLPHATPRAKPPVKKRDRPSPEKASVDVEPIEGLADLAGELAGIHAAVKRLLPAKKKGRVSRKAAFLAAFPQCCSITRSAAAAGVCREMHYEWLETDANYARAFELARDKAGDILEDEAVRRAHQGTVQPVYYVGQLCGVIRQYSDGLLTTLLKGARPDKYRDRIDLKVKIKNRFSGSMTELLEMYRTMTKGEA